MKNRKERDIFPNVDLYSASVYYMLNIPMDLNTPIFAVSRVSGWAAHVIEEKFAEAAPKPMLYRPKATYVGKYEGPQGCEGVGAGVGSRAGNRDAEALAGGPAFGGEGPPAARSWGSYRYRRRPDNWGTSGAVLVRVVALY